MRGVLSGSASDCYANGNARGTAAGVSLNLRRSRSEIAEMPLTVIALEVAGPGAIPLEGFVLGGAGLIPGLRALRVARIAIDRLRAAAVHAIPVSLVVSSGVARAGGAAEQADAGADRRASSDVTAGRAGDSGAKQAADEGAADRVSGWVAILAGVLLGVLPALPGRLGAGRTGAQRQGAGNRNEFR